MQIYIYLNLRGRIVELSPDSVVEHKDRWGLGYLDVGFKEKTNSEERREDGLYHRILALKPGVIKNHQLWLEEADLEKARMIFLQDVTKRYEKIQKTFDSVLDEKRRLERGE